MGPIGTFELLVILAILLLLFGTKVPKLARSLGQAQREFRAGTQEESADEDPKRGDTTT